MKFKLIFILFCFISLNIYAQGGTIKGRVTDRQYSEPLIGANVIILGTELGVATDIDGYYEISNIFPGMYDIRAAFIGYATMTWQGVRVTASRTTTLNFELEWDATSPVEIIQEKPLYEKMPRGCGLWSEDIIPIKEFYYINTLDSFKYHPPELKPVVVEHPSKEN
ncbi:MAG: carboxypeptidase-like regulatory domain-containing protein [Ignavibacteriaceae bacterium]|jgi:hypothetical protein|nr:carboxypeptidase-like regulatory domain-containing protein [Ignavibacteriaceae bacterium]MCW8824419.1 carboxypeptidase-like regulatory domain-containing protein [Ignavibacteriaceae bacterium]MCW8961380.1 carboxypeptidase-like regulatory domain-containing protein [Ignavibacteriaceae bacterium]